MIVSLNGLTMPEHAKNEAFDPSAALAVLEHIVERPSAVAMPSADVAWESAWIACLTGTQRWVDTATDEFADLMQELACVVHRINMPCSLRQTLSLV